MKIISTEKYTAHNGLEVTKEKYIDDDGMEVTKEIYENGIVIEERKDPNSVAVESDQTKLEPISEYEILQAEILLNQMEILANQNAQDKTLAAILLNQMEV